MIRIHPSKTVCSVMALAMVILAGCEQKKTIEPSSQWTPEQAQAWYDAQPWLSGCNYIPATAINQIEMWSADTYDPAQIDKELGWAEELGFNTLRVFLSSVVYENDPEGLISRMDDFLNICNKHRIRPFFVFFDDCGESESTYGPQPAPQPGIHNSDWLQDPPAEARADTTALYPVLEAYVKDIVGKFRGDDRILLWDLYNEPGNSDYDDSSLPLIKNAFRWVREAGVSQPVTAGIWSKLGNLNSVQLDSSDIITYHCYAGELERQQLMIDTLRTRGRPLINTEYMARTLGCTFGKVMPFLKENNVGAINWGFVAGKTNTIFAWDTPQPDVSEPEVWFHDIFRADHTPFSEEEIKVIKECNR